MFVGADQGPRLVRQEIQIKKLAKLITEAVPLVHPQVHRSEGYLSVAGEPIVRITVGNAQQGATKVQWSDAAARNGIADGMQRQVAAALAAAFADPISSTSRP